MIAPQLALARGDTLAQNARNFALIAMAVNDAFIGSFEAKYHYGLWRPETAIRAGADRRQSAGRRAIRRSCRSSRRPAFPATRRTTPAAAAPASR